MRIVVTKLKEKSEGLYELFQSYGHQAIVVPTMQAKEPTDPGSFSRLTGMISRGEIDILVFTSALGVDKLFKKITPGKNVRIVSVGPKTAIKVKEYGMSSEVIDSFSSENFAGYLGDIRGKTIGIARAEVPNTELSESLAAKGARIIEACVYRLEPVRNNFSDLIKDADAVIFTSTKSFESSGFDKEMARKIRVIAIGRKTAEGMRMHGIVPDIVGNGTVENCLALLDASGAADTCK